MVPMSSAAVTKIGPRMLGSRCRTATCQGRLPASRAAAIKSLRRSASVWLRARRAYLGQLMAASASTALTTPPPSTAATASANTSPGKARQRSDRRISTASAAPPA